MKTKHIILLILCSLNFALLSAQLKLPAIFSNNMVLQQQNGVPIWGESTPNKLVTIKTSWNKQTYTTKSDSKGKWWVKVSTPKAGGPYFVQIASEKESLELKNVLIGDVWLCSGQSNMEMPIEGWGKINNFETEKSKANYSNIRLVTLKHNTSTSPIQDLEVEDNSWQVCSPQSVADFSAVAYFFGRNIHQTQNVPIGLIVSSWGGTIAEAWVSAGSLKQMPDFTAKVEGVKLFGETKTEDRINNYSKLLDEWDDEVNPIEPGMKEKWASLSYADNSWSTIKAPGAVDEQGYADFDGFMWYRKQIEIPKSWANQELTLSLGLIDDVDVTFFNGEKVGRMGGHAHDRVYTIPANLVKAGKALIAIRVLDLRYGAGLVGSEDKLYISKSRSEKIHLAGTWKFKTSLTIDKIPRFPESQENEPNRAAVLYNAMIHPIVPFSIKGAIWYQGEANVDRAYQYRDLMPYLISDWRKQWKSDFPFYLVQLANFTTLQTLPEESAWAELREAQLRTAENLANTGMAVTIDLGEADDIHPKNKQDVGLRLALAARANTYGEQVDFSGPIYKSFKIEGNRIRLSFKHIAGGLKTKDNQPLRGFVVAGLDHKFYWAKATIEGDDIIVYSPEVDFPIAVRYAWANNPICNLYNAAGLPASPFRTDDWEGVTFNKK